MTRTELARRLAPLGDDETVELRVGDLRRLVATWPDIPNHTMTASEVAEQKAIRLSDDRVRDLAREGEFSGAYQQGRRWMFPPQSVRRYLRRKQQETRAKYDWPDDEDDVPPAVQFPEAGQEPSEDGGPGSTDGKDADFDPNDPPDMNAFENEYDE